MHEKKSRPIAIRLRRAGQPYYSGATCPIAESKMQTRDIMGWKREKEIMSSRVEEAHKAHGKRKHHKKHRENARDHKYESAKGAAEENFTSG